MQILTIWDLILTPIYLLILTAIAIKQRDRRYPVGHPLRRYFLPGLYVKFGGAIFIALVYQYYYGGYSDSFYFYAHSKIINSSLKDSFFTWYKLLSHVPVTENPEIYPYVSRLFWYSRDASSYFVSVIGAVLGLLNGTTYIPIAILFAYFAFTGIWAMFRTFVNLYPRLHKPLALAFLFIPSVFVWGSGFFKDTVCIFALGWMTYSAFRIFINKDLSFRNFLYLIFSFTLLALTKIYILIAFLPALSFWILMTYSHHIRSAGARFITRILVVGILIISFFFFSQRFSNELTKYSLENISKTAENTRNYIGYVSEKEGGSGYNLGEFDGSLTGMLSKFPAAVVVTLFRPFPWEAGKIIVILSSLEAALFLFFTIKTFYRNGIIKNVSFIIKDPNLMFCLVFSLIFAFAVGITSYNFGALSRYKIPCLPFYSALLVLLLNKNRNSNKKLINRKAPVLIHPGN